MKVADLYRSPNALAPYYRRFRVEDRLLLTGHSHQAWPDVGFDAHQQAWHDAAEHVDEEHGGERSTQEAHLLEHLPVRDAGLDSFVDREAAGSIHEGVGDGRQDDPKRVDLPTDLGDRVGAHDQERSSRDACRPSCVQDGEALCLVLRIDGGTNRVDHSLDDAMTETRADSCVVESVVAGGREGEDP